MLNVKTSAVVGVSVAAVGAAAAAYLSGGAGVAQAQPCERMNTVSFGCGCPEGIGVICSCQACEGPGGIWCQEWNSESCDACGGEPSQGCNGIGSCNCGGGGSGSGSSSGSGGY
jgi:hypothetical protein